MLCNVERRAKGFAAAESVECCYFANAKKIGADFGVPFAKLSPV